MENKSVFERFLKEYKDEKIVIATHNKADPDAIATAYALHRVLKNSVIASDEEMREGAKMLCEKLGITVLPFNKIEKSEWEGLAVVDCSSYTLLPAAKEWELLFILDHHQSEGRDMKAKFTIIDEEAASAAEVIASLLNDEQIDKNTAFALGVAIIADGARFKSATLNGFEQLIRMMKKSGAKYKEMLMYAEPELSAEKKLEILSNAKKADIVVAEGYVVALGTAERGESEVSSFLTECVDVAFIVRKKGEETRVSARARKHVKVPLNKVMAEVAKKLGGAGGGHEKAAGASIRGEPNQVLRSCLEEFIHLARQTPVADR